MRKLPAITQFAGALSSPEGAFAALGRFSSDGAVHRTALFAEGAIERDGQRWLLCAPVRGGSIESAAASLAVVDGCGCRMAGDCVILRDGFLFCDDAGERCVCDLLLHRLPEGERLDSAVTHIDAAVLLRAVADLRDEFLRCGIRHRNLKPSNLLWCGDEGLHPLRCWYTVAESDAAAIEREFDAVEEYVKSFSEFAAGSICAEGCEGLLSEGIDEIYPPSDMMVMIRRGELYGYAHMDGRIAVEPCYVYAEPFGENRAVVSRGAGRMGVIDREGRYIVAAEYDMACFDAVSGETTVLRGRSVAGRFDYFGRLLSPDAGAEMPL